ncbi:hypothetical protein ABN028_06020 [Actinopolymorpha sp. B17G11]
MARLSERVRAFFHGEQAQRLTRQAREQLRKPGNQRRLRQLVHPRRHRHH